jgi:hypothetical protein
MSTKRRYRAEARAIKKWVDPLVRVIVNTKDGSYDRLVPKDIVMEKYRNAELVFDMTNEQYAVPENGVEPDWLKQFNRI